MDIHVKEKLAEPAGIKGIGQLSVIWGPDNFPQMSGFQHVLPQEYGHGFPLK